MTTPRNIEADITLVEGDAFELEFTVTTDGATPFDLTGYTASAQSRLKRNSTAALDIALTATIVSAAAGTMRVSATGPEVDAVTPWLGAHDWQCVITTGGDERYTVREGRSYFRRKVVA